AEEELFQARNLESVGVLAGGIAHDFNNLLTILLGNIALAKAQSPEGPIQQVLQDSEEACARAALLASQLLTFAKGGAPVRCIGSLGQLLRDAIRMAELDTSKD